MKPLFAGLSRWGGRAAILTEDARELSYAHLVADADRVAGLVSPGDLVFTLCSNTFESIAGYAGFVRAGTPQALLNGNLDAKLLRPLIEAYRPEHVYLPTGRAGEIAGRETLKIGGYSLVRTDYRSESRPHSDLALLLATSGSTGTPKFVRVSANNLAANAESIAQSLGVDGADRPITTLPMSYSYGLSILNSHFERGATVVLSTASVARQEFWKTIREKKATTFGGVPFIFDVLKKLQFARMELPSLRYLTQAGGKMAPGLVREFCEICEAKGLRFVSMYGQTEATARMSYLPWEKAKAKAGSIGICIPGGKFWLEDEKGAVIRENRRGGELVYEGPNVSLGYAESREDLTRGDDNHGVLRTGDLAERDEDGFYYILGRKTRFLKVFGHRINLVEVENLVAAMGVECACGGSDDDLTIYVTGDVDLAGLRDRLNRLTGLPLAGIKVVKLSRIPRSESGKVLYGELKKSA